MLKFSDEIPFRTVGLDLGDLRSAYCRLDENGKILEEGAVPTTPEAFKEAWGIYAPCRFVIEASCQSSWVSRVLEGLGHEVIVANPRHLQLISKSGRKTDRNDANLLARLGRADPALLHPITHRSEKSAAVRTLLRARSGLVGTRTRLINMVRAEAKFVGQRLATCSSRVFHAKAKAALPPAVLKVLGPVLKALAEIEAHIETYDREVEKLCEHEYPKTRLLQQVAGVGPLISLTYVVTIDDETRFTSSKSLGCYLGLTPRSYQSGGRDPQLRISKHGDHTLRHMLVSAAAYILRSNSPDCDLKRHGVKLARSGSPRDRARARVAVARKLAVLLHRLLVTGEVYEPLRSAHRAA